MEPAYFMILCQQQNSAALNKKRQIKFSKERLTDLIITNFLQI
jgi:hypothetical protein